METKRIIIYPKDVQRITGKSERFGRMLLKQIKHQLSKKEHQFVTVHEFCKYAGIDVQEISDFIKD